MNQIAQLAAIDGPLLVGVGVATRAYIREGTKNWRNQNPEEAAAHDQRKAEKKNRNLSPQQFRDQ